MKVEAYYIGGSPTLVIESKTYLEARLKLKIKLEKSVGIQSIPWHQIVFEIK